MIEGMYKMNLSKLPDRHLIFVDFDTFVGSEGAGKNEKK
jgi:hypothetical protein